MDIPKDLLSKDFISQFQTEEDVSNFLTDLHARVLEQMLEGEMDAHLGYEKHSSSVINSGNSRNGSYEKKIQTKYGESIIEVPRDRQGEFEPVVVPKHQSRGLSRRNEGDLWYNSFYFRHIHHHLQSITGGYRMAEPSP